TRAIGVHSINGGSLVPRTDYGRPGLPKIEIHGCIARKYILPVKEVIRSGWVRIEDILIGIENQKVIVAVDIPQHAFHPGFQSNGFAEWLGIIHLEGIFIVVPVILIFLFVIE